MGKIYNPPNGFQAPNISISRYNRNIQDYFKACDLYITAIQRAMRQSYGKTCPEAGKLISFPVADGKALYVVATLKPVALVHVDTGDAYHHWT